jgi:protoporphyrinogen oxidase
MPELKIIILGAGPAGLGAAYRLVKERLAQVSVIEMKEKVGGNAGSFELAGLPVDYGSHRLHPACDPVILKDIQALLGDDLLDRPRHGRIFLKGRWIRFPLNPVDLALRLPPDFLLGMSTDFVKKIFPNKQRPGHGSNNISPGSFAEVMEQNLGKTICNDFYFPYAKKIWGLEPGELSPIQAQRRVSANSFGKLARKVLASLPGRSMPGHKPAGGRFFYPRHGYGQISEAYYQAAVSPGLPESSRARFYFKSRVIRIQSTETGYEVGFDQNGELKKIAGHFIWSTIPLTALARCLVPPPPSELLEAAHQIHFRAMILVYLVLKTDHFSEWDAHYFPGLSIPITRLSEPKNYSGQQEPKGLTVLCAELPCNPEDDTWNLPDNDLAGIVQGALQAVKLPIQVPILQVHVERIRYAYPIYRTGYETYFNQLDDYLSQQERLLTFGRQGLFAHDNTHHALYMAYRAVDCLDAQGKFDFLKWQNYRKIFESHVVED